MTRISVTNSSFYSGEVGFVERQLRCLGVCRLRRQTPCKYEAFNQHVLDDFLVQNLGQGYQPGGVKVLAAYQAVPLPRVKTAPRQAVMPKTLFTLTRQAGQVWKSYYYAGGARVAMRQVDDTNNDVYYLLTDHLGSTSVTYRVRDGQTQRQYYKPWGEYRPGPDSSLPTDRTFQGQLDSGWGLLNFKARWFDPVLGRFAQADTMIPSAVKSIAWDRYAGLGNNPVKYSDPSGHDVCDEEGNCYNAQGWYRAKGAGRLSSIDTWKMMILGKYGVTMSDEGGKAWDLKNLKLVYTSLGNINTALEGKIRSFSNGAVFKLGIYTPEDDCPNCTYKGRTSDHTITFFTMGDAAIRQMNIYHEFGHLVNNHFENPFTEGSFDENPPPWVENGYISDNAITSPSISNDPNYPRVQAKQASGPGGSEIWADAFANYVAGNIDLGDPNGQGMDMYNFVTGELFGNP